MGVNRKVEFKNHITGELVETETSTNFNGDEVIMIKVILEIYSKFGSPNFDNYKAITVTIPEIDDDGNFTDNEYETPLINIKGYELEFEDIISDFDILNSDNLLDLVIIMQEHSKIMEK